jgi:quinol monooxygenase YgiN
MVKLEQLTWLAIGVLIGYLATTRYSLLNSRKDSTVNPHAFILAIQIKFKSIEKKNEFKALFKPLAEYVTKNEPNTLAYELFDSDKEETTIFLLERYRTKNDYLEVHRKTDQFLFFKENMMKMAESFEMNGHSYIQSDFGFV